MFPSNLVQERHLMTVRVHAGFAQVGFDRDLVLRKAVTRLEKHVRRTISLFGLGFRTGFFILRGHDRLDAGLLSQRFTVFQSPHLIGQTSHSNVVSIVGSPVAIAVLGVKPIISGRGACERSASHRKQSAILRGISKLNTFDARNLGGAQRNSHLCMLLSRWLPHRGE